MELNPAPSKPFIIPVFLPHTGCPHRCAFCDQWAITGRKVPFLKPDQVRREIRTFLGYKKGSRTPVQISFYGGNFLGQPEKRVRRLLDIASEFIQSSAVDSLRFSTRPDTVDPRRLAWLADYRVATVELGAQSMQDHVLRNANRGHTARDTENAVALLKNSGYETGLQMMLGLPGDDTAGALETGRRMLGLAPDFVRIYPLLVLAGSPLADWFAAGRYTPLTLAAAVDITAQLYRIFVSGGVRVIRMGLQTSAEISRSGAVLAGPCHPAFGQLVKARLFYDGACHAIRRAKKPGTTISIAVNPRCVSSLRGDRNGNIDSLKRLFSIEIITILSKPEIAETEVVVNDDEPVSILAGA